MHTPPYKHDKVFQTYFGDEPSVRVMDFLINCNLFPSREYCPKEIALSASVSPQTLDGILEGLLAKGILVLGRKIGRAQMYTVARNNVTMALQNLSEAMKAAQTARARAAQARREKK